MSVRMEPNGTWMAQVWYRDYNGDSRHKTKRGFKSEGAASAWEEEFSSNAQGSVSSTFAAFIARDEDDLVFVACQVTQNSGEGFPEENADLAALERLTAAYLAEPLNFEDVLVRFDVVSLLVVGEGQAFLPHHLNAHSAHSKRGAPGTLNCDPNLGRN